MKRITLDEAIAYVDEQCPNQFTRENKIAWLSELDNLIFEKIIKDRENPEITEFDGYDDETDGDTVLLVPFLYKEIYRFYIEKNINYSNRELGAYNNAMQMFNAYYEEYYSWYNRNHKTTKTVQFDI
ncbi:MAG: hypothetical protein IJ731_01185 [Eubacterium sp.]|nr:hypothetical protein [Eubacterium sp.]